MTDFKLIKECFPGLSVVTAMETYTKRYIEAEELERMLSEAPVVSNNQDDFTGSPWRYAHGRNPQAEGDTHTARLIGIKPIVRESEETKLLREAANYLTRNYPLMSHPENEKYRAHIAYRIEKLLEAQNGG